MWMNTDVTESSLLAMMTYLVGKHHCMDWVARLILATFVVVISACVRHSVAGESGRKRDIYIDGIFSKHEGELSEKGARLM